MFTSLPCEGQLRLAIVVAAETLPFVDGSSVRVKGRNCALDVCWEGKKFRVICSHLRPSSVMHVYAEDPEDLPSLVTSRGNETHVHICVDAQTGLGTRPSRPYSSDVGNATTVSYRVEKQRILEHFIMENLLTATTTFQLEDDGPNNIYTCTYNGKHEQQQQIDYIFSSDTFLRSRTFDSPATKSEHWGLIVASKSKHAKTLRKKTDRKPIGWECRDRVSYNDVRARANMNVVSFVQETHCAGREGGRHFDLYVFTDGSARKISRKVTCAG